MFKIHILSGSLLFAGVLQSLSFADITPLSTRASGIKSGMTRTELLRQLGNPTWAIIPGDKGDYTISPTDTISLKLFWKNSPCNPVAVTFYENERVNGWDEGRVYCGN